MVRLPCDEAVRGSPPALGEVDDGMPVLGGRGDVSFPGGGR